VRHMQKSASFRLAPKRMFFLWRNITPERSCGTGEAERVRWVYEWGRGFESGAKDATALFFCEDGSTSISHHLWRLIHTCPAHCEGTMCALHWAQPWR
jgi:hypothetical protein